MSGAGLLPLAEAQARLLALAPRLPVVERPLEQAAGHFLAGEAVARLSRPATATSAMDGYAVHAGDGGGPWRVVGESAAGHPFARALAHGEAVRIATGALLPAGADTVLIQEDCCRDGQRLSLAGTLPGRGGNVRLPGTDFAAGCRLLAAGSALSPGALALLLADGWTSMRVRRAPRIALIDCGDELVAPGTALPPGQAVASNSAMLAAMLSALPCAVARRGPIPDRLDTLSEALAACDDADIVVSSGGASVGDHDLVRPALAAIGARLEFWKVAIKPGKPLLVAERATDAGRQVILGLPGNPASAFVTAFLFLLPLVRAALGAGQPLPASIATRLAAPVPPTGPRAEFLRGRWDGAAVTALATQDSGALLPLAAANALIVRPAHEPAQPAGAPATIHWLENGGVP